MNKDNFLGKLFDFSFKEFITLQIIKYIYIIGIIFAGFTAFGMIGTGFAVIREDFLRGILCILFSPVFFILLTLAARLVLEALVATFRIAENTTKLVEGDRRLD
ncbi:MAG TPA: DUF4282 domain-containing protein [Chlorobaculum sp.]|nr:DUF4282 domain-containing protein [Chlorobaculum sp.]